MSGADKASAALVLSLPQALSGYDHDVWFTGPKDRRNDGRERTYIPDERKLLATSLRDSAQKRDDLRRVPDVQSASRDASHEGSGEGHRDDAQAGLPERSSSVELLLEAERHNHRRDNEYLLAKLHYARRMLQALDAYWFTIDGLPKCRWPRGSYTPEDWWGRYEKYRALLEGSGQSDSGVSSAS